MRSRRLGRVMDVLDASWTSWTRHGHLGRVMDILNVDIYLKIADIATVVVVFLLTPLLLLDDCSPSMMHARLGAFLAGYTRVPPPPLFVSIIQA